MKADLILKIVREAKSKPKLWRKIKIFVAVGFAGLLVVSALTIWAGIAAFNYMATKATDVLQSPTAQAQAQSLKSDLATTKIQPLSCWAKAQSLLAVEPWLQRTPGEILSNLKVACLEEAAQPCKGEDCTNIKKLLNTAEGITL